MSSRVWVYDQALGNSKGVTLTDARIEWWESGVSFAGGGWSEQSFAEFFVNGPHVEDVPSEVVAELVAATRALLSRSAADGAT